MSYNESLRSDSNYPSMSQSQWDKAPFNQEDIKEEEFNVVISQSLSKETTVWSNDYITEEDENGYIHDDTSNIEWKKEYDKQHYTPLGLIERFKELLNEPNVRNILGKETDILIKECEGWVEDEILVVEN